MTFPEVPQPPTTTTQQDLTVAGQRRINLIWEFTQAIIAVLIVMAVVVASLFNVFNRLPVEVPTILSTMGGMIIGFYYARTNHQAIGGIGMKANEQQPYVGR